MDKISKEIENKVIELKKNGCSYNQIMGLVKISKGSISRICKENNLATNYIELTPEKIEECQKLYNEIGNIKRVAKISGISYDRLRNVIKSKQITPKKRDTSLYRREIKKKLVEYKGGKCQICNYSRCYEALEFHHLNPAEKDFQISGGTRSFETLKKEVDKCILVCANCHREIHSGIINL